MTLAASALALGWAATRAERSRPLLVFIAGCWALYGVAFGVVGLTYVGLGALALLPQPLLCFPVAALAGWGARPPGRADALGRSARQAE